MQECILAKCSLSCHASLVMTLNDSKIDPHRQGRLESPRIEYQGYRNVNSCSQGSRNHKLICDPCDLSTKLLCALELSHPQLKSNYICPEISWIQSLSQAVAPSMGSHGPCPATWAVFCRFAKIGGRRAVWA
jgi:hypothetical protein